MSSLFDVGLRVYRGTIKRVKPLHQFSHWVMSHAVIPVLERRERFRTIPDDPFWFRMELLTNRHEQETMTHVHRVVGPGMTVLDIGAHVGFYARQCAELVGNNGRVLAFEPHPRTFAVLEQNTARFSQVSVHQMAIAEERGTAELHDYLMMSASGSLNYDPQLADLQRSQTTDNDHAPRLNEGFAAQTFTVDTAPIDAILAEKGIERVDFVKMDIEGAELGALRSMRQTIAASPGMTLIMEYNPHALQAFDLDPVAALDEVIALGFDRIQVIEADGNLTDITGDQATTRTLAERLMQHMDVVNLFITKAGGDV